MSNTPQNTPNSHIIMRPYDDPDVMAETLILTLRRIGIRVWLDSRQTLRIVPKTKLADYDLQVIDELHEPMIRALRNNAV